MKINKMIRKRKGASGGMRTRKTRASLETLKKKHGDCSNSWKLRNSGRSLSISASRPLVSPLSLLVPQRENGRSFYRDHKCPVLKKVFLNVIFWVFVHTVCPLQLFFIRPRIAKEGGIRRDVLGSRSVS